MADNNNPIRYSDLVSPDNSITDLIKQLDELSDTYTNALKNIKTEAIELAKMLKKVSGATEEGRNTTKKAADDADRLARAQKELAFAESENAKKLAELRLAQQEANQINKLVVKLNQSAEGSYNRLSAQYSLNKIYLNNMTKAERENTEEGRKLVAQTKEIYEEMKRLQEATGKFQLNVGNYTEASDAIIAYGDKLKETLGLNNQFGESLLALGRGGAESKAAFAAIGDGAKALGKTLLTLLANPVFLAIAGIAAAGAAFKWWYDYNTGLVEATRLTQQFTGKSGDDLKAFRNEVQAVADAFNKDFKETLIATNSLSKQFGISANEALELIKDGFLSGADANGKFLDTLKEYPAYFKEAGISVDQFVAIVAQTTKMGIFSDKGVDAIKEANLRLREMTTATAAALEGIGISSDQVQKDLQSGAKTTFDVMQEVSAKLAELPDNAAVVGTAIADIFGGPGEDAGLQYLRTLKDISTSLDEVKEKSGELAKLQEEQLQSQIELQNALSALFDATGGNFETLTTKVKVFSNNALTFLIQQIIYLTNHIIDLYNESFLIRGIFEAINAVIKSFGDIVANVFGAAVEVISGFGDTLAGVLKLDWEQMNAGAKRVLDSIPNLVGDTVKDIKENLDKGVANMNRKIKPITIPVSVGETQTNVNKTITTNAPSVNPKGKSDAEKAAERQAKQIEEAYKKNLEATRKLQDAQLQLETDEWAKRRQQTQYQYSRQIEDLQHQLQTEKDLNENGRQAINATITALEQQQTEALLKIEQDRQLQELALQKESIELRLQAVKEGSEQERQLRMQLLENERQTALLKNQQKPTGQQQNAGVINASFDAKGAGIADEYLQSQLQIFDQQQALAQSEFDLLKNTEAQKTQFRLQAEKERLQKVLELNQQAANKLSDIEVQTIQNTIKKLDQEIEQSKQEEQGKDIYSLFGLNLGEEQKQAISTSVSFAIDQLNQFLAARVEAANAAVDAANKEVDSAQNALDQELEARANGYANNVLMAQKELELAKKNQQKALKEQEKAQKAQAAVQTVMQIGNLVSATALIWSQLGFPFAIPAIAIMWGSFAAAKIKAAQLAKNQETETYGSGTVELLQGGSHQSGNDVDLGTKADGTRRRAEGGEFFAVINKRNSRRFRKIIPDVINSLNDGTFLKKYTKSYDAGGNVILNNSNDVDWGNIKDDVERIRKQGEKKYYTDAKGNVVESYKNLKRVIRK